VANPVYYRVGRAGSALLFALKDHAQAGANNTLLFTVNSTTILASPDETEFEAIVEDDAPQIMEDSLHVLQIQPRSLAHGALLKLVKTLQDEEPWDSRLESYVWKQRSFFQTQDDLADLIWKGSVLSRLIMAKQE